MQNFHKMYKISVNKLPKHSKIKRPNLTAVPHFNNVTNCFQTKLSKIIPQNLKRRKFNKNKYLIRDLILIILDHIVGSCSEVLERISYDGEHVSRSLFVVFRWCEPLLQQSDGLTAETW